ncbi:hypothetical protein [Leifsonia sp. NPDC077715]|uniref:hypothetical protein n=1 Tax=Leifsonia sp. NPDC077715 TaxID=3155539 RepID=UPI0034363AE1
MMQQVTVTFDVDWDIYEAIERLAKGSLRTVDEELHYIIGQAAVGEPVDPRPGIEKLHLVDFIRNRVEALDQ